MKKLSLSRIILVATVIIFSIFGAAPVFAEDWYEDLLQENVTWAMAIEKAATIAKERINEYGDIDSFGARVPKGESCNETAFALGHAIINDPEFNVLTPGWEVHTVRAEIAPKLLLAHTTTVLVPPKPQGWKEGDPYLAYAVDNYTGSVSVEPMQAVWHEPTGGETKGYYGYVFTYRPGILWDSSSTLYSTFNLFGGIKRNTIELKQHELTAGDNKALNVQRVLDPETGTYVWKKLDTSAVPTNPYSQWANKDSAPKNNTKVNVQVVQSRDPNAKTGPLGVGAQHVVNGKEAFLYTVFFENVATASAPAQRVHIEDELSDELDLMSLELLAVTFGDFVLLPTSGSKSFVGYQDLRPAKNIVVKVVAMVNSRTLEWDFTSLDSTSAENPEDMTPLAEDDPEGFLPPNVSSPQGEGSVAFRIKVADGVAHGTTISNDAKIVFDKNSPIDTNQWSNTIDSLPPVTSVSSLAGSQPTADFSVSWDGVDQGLSGIRDFTIWVAINGAEPQIWLSNTPLKSSVFQGENGSTYAFYSIGRDAAGNSEVAPLTAQASTVVFFDKDGDGVGDSNDNCPDVQNPSQDNSDGDAFGDACDLCPLDNSKVAPLNCGCGLSEADSDGDSTPDCLDSCPNDAAKVAPGACGCGVVDIDSDQDGTSDCIDSCPEDSHKTTAGMCGCGVSEVDSDGDSTPDCVDSCPSDSLKVVPGACGCGVSDVDNDSDGTADCADFCPKDPRKVTAGICGCGVEDKDANGNGIIDCLTSKEFVYWAKKLEMLVSSLKPLSLKATKKQIAEYKAKLEEIKRVLNILVSLLKDAANTTTLKSGKKSLPQLMAPISKNVPKLVKSKSSSFASNKKQALQAVKQLTKVL